MKKNRLLPLLGLCATLGLASTASHANLIISNLNSDPSTTGSPVVFAGGFQENKAFGFTMPAGDVYSLDSVTVTLDTGGLGLDATVNLNADLFADVGSNPGGSPLVSFDPLTLGPLPANYIADHVFTPSTPFLLQPLTTYWFAIEGIGTGLDDELNWTRRGTNTTPTGIATSVGYRLSKISPYPPTGPSDVFNSLRIDGTPVPEPGPLALMMVGLAGISSLRLRRRPSA